MISKESAGLIGKRIEKCDNKRSSCIRKETSSGN